MLSYIIFFKILSKNSYIGGLFKCVNDILSKTKNIMYFQYEFPGNNYGFQNDN